MQTKFRVVSLSHKSAPVHIRELISLDEAAIQRLLLKLKEFFSVSDALILSTCNRTEVYYSHELDLSVELVKLIGMERGLADAISYLDYFEVLNDSISLSASCWVRSSMIMEPVFISVIMPSYSENASPSSTSAFNQRCSLYFF